MNRPPRAEHASPHLLAHPLAQRLARSLFAALLGLTLVVMLTPADELADPGLDDKVSHLLTFAALAVAGRLALVPVRPLAVALAAYALLTEVLQALLPIGRHGDPLDWLADVAGVGLGLALAAVPGLVVRRR